MANAARRIDSKNSGRARPSQGREAPAPELTGMRSDLKDRVNKVISNMPANNSDHFRDAAAEPKEDHNDHAGHGGHGASIIRKVRDMDVDLLDVKAAVEGLMEAGDAMGDGLLDKPTLRRALDGVLEAVPVPAVQKLRWGMPLIIWALGKAFHIPDHPPEKVKVDYSNLSGQILRMHPDHGRPNSYHHALVALLMSIEEDELRENYSSFFEQATFTAQVRTAEGRKDLKEEFGSLFGKKTKTRAQFLVRSRQMLERMGTTFVDATPGSAIANSHHLRERHAEHSRHVLEEAIVNMRTWITDANIAQITRPVDDIKLEKDLHKTGDTLMEHVKGNTDLATQFLGNINLASFDKAFHGVLSDRALEDSMYDEPELVKEQICQVFNFSPKENVSTNDLNNFTAVLIGPATLNPATGLYVLHATDGGALGPRTAIPATDTATLTKYDDFRNRLNGARNRLLAPARGTPPQPTRLSLIFPPRATTIKYNEFGLQLGRTVRGKSGTNLQRARTAFMRGWEEEEFNHFLVLLDSATLTSAAAGSKAEKDMVKAKIAELTGLNVTKVTPALFRSRIAALRDALGTTGATAGPVDADVAAKRTTLDALLTGMVAATPGSVVNNIESLYLDVNLEEKLGEAIQTASDAATASALFDRINGALLMGHYSQVTQAETTVMGMSLLNQQRFKAQLAAFIGAPKNFVWNNITYGAMIAGLNTKITMANTIRPPIHPGSTELAPFMTNVSGFSATFLAHLNTI